MNAYIRPTVGRVVWYYPPASEGWGDGPLAAMIAHVWSDKCVNLVALAPAGFWTARSSVPLMQPGEDRPRDNYCRWPDFAAPQFVPPARPERDTSQAMAKAIEPTCSPFDTRMAFLDTQARCGVGGSVSVANDQPEN